MNVLKFVPIFLLVGTIALYSSRNYSSEEYKAPSGQVIYLKATGYGKEHFAAVENAEISAFEMLLFKGVPGSAQPTPLISDELRSKQAHHNYFMELLKKKRYKSFIVRRNSVKQKVKGDIEKIDLGLNVDVEALKKDLKENNVISI